MNEIERSLKKLRASKNILIQHRSIAKKDKRISRVLEGTYIRVVHAIELLEEKLKNEKQART